MSDIVDHANHLAELQRLVALANVPKNRPPSSVCLYCKEPLTDRTNFCDTDCRDDYQRYQSAARRNIPIESFD